VRTVYLGTSAFAAAVLERLADSPHRPQLVVTRPDRPRGRGRRLQAPPVAVTAKVLGTELSQPEDVNGEEARARIAAAAPDVVCVCSFGALLREPLLSEHELLNVHPSLLPRWRGAAPVERAIMAGDAETGVAIMRLTAGLDSGPVCLVEREPIRGGDTYGSLSGRLAALGGELLVRALDERPPFAEQDDALATYAEKIGPEDRRLDPSRPAVELERVVRALTPHVGASVELRDGGRLGVRGARLYDGSAVSPGAFGNEGGRLVLGCATGALELTVVQPPGGRPMPAADYLRGHGLPG
jgi:methionyl-tRNA formyltransferase